MQSQNVTRIDISSNTTVRTKREVRIIVSHQAPMHTSWSIGDPVFVAALHGLFFSFSPCTSIMNP